MKTTLTAKQTALLRFILRYSRQHGCPPSLQEMQAELGWNHVSLPASMVLRLEHKGCLRKILGKNRTLLVTAQGLERLGEPVCYRYDEETHCFAPCESFDLARYTADAPPLGEPVCLWEPVPARALPSEEVDPDVRAWIETQLKTRRDLSPQALVPEVAAHFEMEIGAARVAVARIWHAWKKAQDARLDRSAYRYSLRKA